MNLFKDKRLLNIIIQIKSSQFIIKKKKKKKKKKNPMYQHSTSIAAVGSLNYLIMVVIFSSFYTADFLKKNFLLQTREGGNLYVFQDA